MVSFKIISVLCATVLFNFSLARPRTPQSSRFPPFSENSAGEFVLWSCTATAQLQKSNVVDKNVIKIKPATVELPVQGLRTSFDKPKAEGDDKINRINIITVNRNPHRNRGRPATVHKKSNSQNTAKNEEVIKHKNFIIPMVDSPLRTIKVNPFGNNMPLLFREKPQLPQVELLPVKEDEISHHGSGITVIKPYHNVRDDEK